MIVAIITTKAEDYHKYLCAEIAKRHNVVAVFHPERKRFTRSDSRELRRRNLRNNGWIYHALKKMTKMRWLNVGWDEANDIAEAERIFMPNAAADYEQLIAPIAHDVADINSQQGIELVAKSKADVVLCSGGPIYKRALIDATGTMLNFHTGVSPIYNGSYSIYWTFANRQPHITGGTLMHMSPVVDGGDILGHFLPEIESNDTPGRQFMKTLIGGVEMYSDFLDDMDNGKGFVSAPQGRPFRLTYDYEWTAFQTIAIQRAIDKNICRRFQRSQIRKDYWRLANRETAIEELKRTIMELMYDGDATD